MAGSSDTPTVADQCRVKRLAIDPTCQGPTTGDELSKQALRRFEQHEIPAELGPHRSRTEYCGAPDRHEC